MDLENRLTPEQKETILKEVERERLLNLAPEIDSWVHTHKAEVRLQLGYLLKERCEWFSDSELREKVEITLPDLDRGEFNYHEASPEMVEEEIDKVLDELDQGVWEEPILNDGYRFINKYLESRYVLDGEGRVRDLDEIKDELMELAEMYSPDYKKLQIPLNFGKARNLDELLECAEHSFESYLAHKKSGEGTYKKVFLVEHKEIPGIQYALLVTNLKDISKKAANYLRKLGRTALENCRGEANRLARLNSLKNENLPSIVNLPKYNPEKGIYWWVEEYVEEKLSDKVTDSPMVVDEVVVILKEISHGLKGANKLGYFHGDLNFDNIGFSQGKLKILDWGLCSTILEGPKTERREFLGDRLTRAPEVYDGKDPTMKSDVWALGIIGYRLLTGQHLFEWSFQGTRNEWQKLSIEEKQQYEDEIKEQSLAYCDKPLCLYAKEPDRERKNLLKILGNYFLNPNPEDRISPSIIYTMFFENQVPTHVQLIK